MLYKKNSLKMPDTMNTEEEYQYGSPVTYLFEQLVDLTAQVSQATVVYSEDGHRPGMHRSVVFAFYLSVFKEMFAVYERTNGDMAEVDRFLERRFRSYVGLNSDDT